MGTIKTIIQAIRLFLDAWKFISGTISKAKYDKVVDTHKENYEKFINGDPNDEVNFPGVVAAGIEATVETPTVRRVTARVSITALDGFEESELAPLVRTEIENYILSLGIGDDVIVSEIVERSMGITGIYNVIVQEPTTDISVAFAELPVPVSAGGSTLVVVN